MFEYLDQDNSRELKYNEFCGICEERRRKIDPYEHSSNGRNNLNHSVIVKDGKIELPPESIYRTNIDLDTLEAVSKLKPLSSTKNIN